MKRALLLLFTAALLRAEAQERDWTLPDQRSLRAVITGIEGGRVLLTPPNSNAPIAVETAQLADADRAAVNQWVPPGRRGPGLNAIVTADARGWPLSVALKEPPAVVVVEQNREAGRYIYRSDHFQFTSSERLNGEIVREFSRLFEVTYETVAALPLGIRPEAPRGYFKVMLYASIEDYHAAGGPKGSGGLFRGATGEVMVPLPNLGVEKVSGRWKMKDREGNQPLIHEVAHQVMGSWLTVLPIWMVEGSAEYLAAGRYSTGKLTLHGTMDHMQAFLLEFKGVKERDIDMRHPKRLMTMNHAQWAKDLASSEGLKNYYSAMLLFYYFAHKDGAGDAAGLKAYFKARPASATPEKDAADRDLHLLRGRSFDQLWDGITAAFATHRIKIR
jgi:hypothetical protein